MLMLIALLVFSGAAGFLCGISSFHPLITVPSVAVALTMWFIVGRGIARAALKGQWPLPSRTPRILYNEMESAFFYRSEQFDRLKLLIPELLRASRRQASQELRFWCVSQGNVQDAFSLAMIVRDAIPYDLGANIRVLATDSDAEAVEKRSHGLFNKAELASLPATYRQRYFIPLRAGFSRSFQVHPRLLEIIRFSQFDLASDQELFKHPFDVIFCRGVLSALATEARAGVVEKLAQSLAPGGQLFVDPDEEDLVASSAFSKTGVGTFARAATIKRKKPVGRPATKGHSGGAQAEL